MRVLVLALSSLCLLLPLHPEAAGFYLREQEGWFWYEREPEPVTTPEPAPSEQPAVPAEPQLSEAAPQGPTPLSAQWIREHIGEYRDAAIDDPTPQSVALYLYLQRVALDKSSRFAAATQRVVQLDPFLDEITQRPTATFAANLTNRQAGDNRDAVLERIAKTAGVLFFFRSDCPYCEAQAPLLKLLEARYGFSVLPVSIDGAPLPGGTFPDFRQDRGQAQALNVVSTPALFLARPPDAMVPLSQGLLSLAQLQERIVIAAVQAGWISEREYTRTRPVTADLMLDCDLARRSRGAAERASGAYPSQLRSQDGLRRYPVSFPANSTLAFLLVLVLLPAAQAADPPGTGIGNQMTEMFDTMLNYTEPTAHLGQRRGVLTGGSLNARNRIMNESLWHFVPPSFDAGCGGIDLFAGSFSFISAEQFQNLLRAIAANAAGYAFEVALGAMCKECLETMETLQKKIQALNQGFANSCQLAKGLVNDVADAFDMKHKDNTSLLGMVKGLGDVFETRSSASGSDPIAQVRDNVPAEEKTEIEGNLVWQALKRKGAAGWFADGEDTLLEAMMSLTGSVIVGSPEAASDGQGDNHRITYLPGNLLKASDLLNGTRDREDSAQWDNAWPHRLRFYQCGPAGGPIDRSENGCREPSVTEDTVNGMIQRVKDVLIGVRPYGSGTETVGLVQKFRLGQGAITDAEQAFMQYAPNGLGAGIRTLARYDEGMARLFVEQAAPVIAVEMTQVILNDLLFAVEQAAALNEHAYAKQLQIQIEQTREQLFREYEVLDDRYGNPQTLLAYYQGLVEEIKGRRYYVAGQAQAAPSTQE